MAKQRELWALALSFTDGVESVTLHTTEEAVLTTLLHTIVDPTDPDASAKRRAIWGGLDRANEVWSLAHSQLDCPGKVEALNELINWWHSNQDTRGIWWIVSPVTLTRDQLRHARGK